MWVPLLIHAPKLGINPSLQGLEVRGLQQLAIQLDLLSMRLLLIRHITLDES